MRSHAHAKHRPFTECHHSNVYRLMELEPRLELESKLSRGPALEDHDTTALTKEQQERLNNHKIVTRLENEHYLRGHPEIPVMIAAFLREVLLKRPHKIREFASEYFTDPQLADKIKARNEDKRN